MRLRTTLLLAFVGLSVLQLLAVVPLALRNLNALLDTQQERRLERQLLTARSWLDRLSAEVDRSLDELVQSDALEELARDAARESPRATLTTAASAAMAPRGLEVLSVFDAQGKTLSCGHLPARLGETDPALFALTQSGAQGPRPVLVDFPGAQGLVSAPALVAARSVDYGEGRVWVVGGLRLTDARAAEVGRLIGAEVSLTGTLEGQAHTWAQGGSVEGPADLRTLPLPPVGTVALRFSRGDLLATRAQVRTAFLALAAISLVLAAVAAFFVSRRVTRPVEALTDATARLAGGALHTQVAVQATGELQTLVESFNRMGTDLRSATERLVASERLAAWQEVAKRLAHELKNPLTPIQMSLETLLAASAKNDPRFQAVFKDSAAAILEEVQRLKRTIDAFSQFARLPRPVLAPLSLAELGAQVLSLYAPHAGGEPARVRFLGDFEPNLWVQADRDQLTQVLVNLLKNAQEAMEGRSGNITARCRSEGPRAILEVVDEGPGVPESQRARILEPYVSTKPNGTGLGLAITLRILEEHGGQLEVGANPNGQGAVFRITLPRLSGPPER